METKTPPQGQVAFLFPVPGTGLVSSAKWSESSQQLPSFQTIFERFAWAIKHMNLGQLYMALLLVRVTGRTKDVGIVQEGRGPEPSGYHQPSHEKSERMGRRSPAGG